MVFTHHYCCVVILRTRCCELHINTFQLEPPSISFAEQQCWFNGVSNSSCSKQLSAVLIMHWNFVQTGKSWKQTEVKRGLLLSFDIGFVSLTFLNLQGEIFVGKWRTCGDWQKQTCVHIMQRGATRRHSSYTLIAAFHAPCQRQTRSPWSLASLRLL